MGTEAELCAQILTANNVALVPGQAPLAQLKAAFTAGRRLSLTAEQRRRLVAFRKDGIAGGDELAFMRLINQASAPAAAAPSPFAPVTRSAPACPPNSESFAPASLLAAAGVGAVGLVVNQRTAAAAAEAAAVAAKDLAALRASLAEAQAATATEREQNAKLAATGRELSDTLRSREQEIEAQQSAHAAHVAEMQRTVSTAKAEHVAELERTTAAGAEALKAAQARLVEQGQKLAAEHDAALEALRKQLVEVQRRAESESAKAVSAAASAPRELEALRQSVAALSAECKAAAAARAAAAVPPPSEAAAEACSGEWPTTAPPAPCSA